MHEESEYKGSPILELKASEYEKYPMRFGVYKAKLILDNLDAIKDFVDKHDHERD